MEILVKDPCGSWIYGKAFFGKQYLPLLKELEELASRKEEGYGVVISFKETPVIHIQISLWLYLKHLSVQKPDGHGLIAGFDLSSDRLNVVVIDRGTDLLPALKGRGFPLEQGGLGYIPF